MGQYSEETKKKIIAEHKAGASVRALSRTYGLAAMPSKAGVGCSPEVELQPRSIASQRSSCNKTGSTRTSYQAFKNGK